MSSFVFLANTGKGGLEECEVGRTKIYQSTPKTFFVLWSDQNFLNKIFKACGHISEMFSSSHNTSLHIPVNKGFIQNVFFFILPGSFKTVIISPSAVYLRFWPSSHRIYCGDHNLAISCNHNREYVAVEYRGKTKQWFERAMWTPWVRLLWTVVLLVMNASEELIDAFTVSPNFFELPLDWAIGKSPGLFMKF